MFPSASTTSDNNPWWLEENAPPMEKQDEHRNRESIAVTTGAPSPPPSRVPSKQKSHRSHTSKSETRSSCQKMKQSTSKSSTGSPSTNKKPRSKPSTSQSSGKPEKLEPSVPIPLRDNTPTVSHRDRSVRSDAMSFLSNVAHATSNWTKTVAKQLHVSSSANSTDSSQSSSSKRVKQVLRSTTPSSSHSSNGNNAETTNTANNSINDSSYRRYSIKELIPHLRDNVPLDSLPPALERRVRDFKFAQNKRADRHGEQNAWGIFGLYKHLSDIRADLEWAEDAAWRRQQGEPYLSWTDFENARDKGAHNRPWFTYTTIAVCTFMLVVTFGVNGWSVEPLNINPLIGPSSDTLVRIGARQTDKIVNSGQWYRLFTPLVLHAGLVHYIINMLALYFIGAAVEQSHGLASAAVLFVLPAVGGNILSAICLPQYISVGASGGIFGLIGGCIADIAIHWDMLFINEEDSRQHFMVLFWLALDMVVNCIIGFTPFVDNFTHLGGFLYGLLCGLSTIERLAVGFFGAQSTSKPWVSTLTRFSGVIISVLCILISTILLAQTDGVTSPCHGCRYISCVPFPPRADDKWWYCDDCDFVTANLFADSLGRYERIDLDCPNGDVETIDVYDDALFDKETIRKELPSYCRDYCDVVFST
eukprot:Nitzschia sp. Nitz4//scaffold366_size23882//20707//22641//NITZ4_008444-RA/size23882-processed-gene-0.29-mRNA-1//1//CDS//3329549317//7850//frame0